MSEGVSELRIDAGDMTLRALRRGRSDGPVVVMLHGYGIPTAEAFDVPGVSWMDDLARRGIEAWAIDLPGFGASDRPGPSPGATRAAAAAPAVAALLARVANEAAARPLHLLGWSFGALVAGRVAAAKPHALHGLVLLGAMHATPYPDGVRALPSSGSAYLPMTPEGSLVQWQAMLDRHVGVVDVAVMDAVIGVVRRIRHRAPVAGATELSRPTGPLLDLRDAWSGRPAFDAAAIRTPTLLVRGALDTFADPQLAAALSHAPVSEHVIPHATHWVMLERARERLFELVAEFLLRSARCGRWPR